MRQKYESHRFNSKSEDLLATINQILEEYQAQGLVMTVRQLYYQLVARNYIPNSEKSYKSITKLVNDGRMAGWLDWDVLEDRTRAFETRARWVNGPQFLESVTPQFHVDMWSNQEVRPYIIIEKEALAGVFARVCREYDVPFLCARGYPSVSVLREWVKYTLIPHYKRGQDILLLHFGDHDPSGIDMSRDLEERIDLFSEGYGTAQFTRLALNMQQIEEENPPPNPAKTTDSRFEEYSRIHGDESWELDALNPRYLVNLASTAIQGVIEPGAWAERQNFIRTTKERLEELMLKY